jgi:hypothetical protein
MYLLRHSAYRYALHAARLFFAAITALSLNAATGQTLPLQTLERYYTTYTFPATIWAPWPYFKYSEYTSSPPLQRDVRGPAGSGAPIERRVVLATQFSARQIEFYQDVLLRPCAVTPLPINRYMPQNTTVEVPSAWARTPLSAEVTSFGSSPVWTFTDTINYGAPLRRKALDGSHYDASPMIMLRNGFPWVTYHWGYRLGLVANTSTWDPANLVKVPALATWPSSPAGSSFPAASDDFELNALPPPWAEDDVVEYVNRADFPKQPAGQYFYAVLPADKTLLDSTANWSRTGNSFKSGGYVSVCRFYGGKNGGPNTHFYSADDKECELLKGIPVLSFEGQTFAVNMPMPAKNTVQAAPGALRDCPIASKPLYRLYNNASASNGSFVSNHRYTTSRADMAAAVAQGWLDEGHVMCVPE